MTISNTELLARAAAITGTIRWQGRYLRSDATQEPQRSEASTRFDRPYRLSPGVVYVGTLNGYTAHVEISASRASYNRRGFTARQDASYVLRVVAPDGRELTERSDNVLGGFNGAMRAVRDEFRVLIVRLETENQ